MSNDISIGPHLLGRQPSEPDDRDRLHLAVERLEQLRAAPPFADAMLDQTLRALVDQGTITNWTQYRQGWPVVKAYAHSVKPSPAPPPPPAPPSPIPATRQRYNVAYLLNQRDSPHCTAFGSAHWGISDPVNSQWTEDQAHAFYYREKQVDGEPEENVPLDQQQGSTVRTAGKVLRELGRVAEYVWIARVDETGIQQTETLVDWLLNHGPVILGTDWYTGMFRPDVSGMVRLTGKIEGGHCYACIGVNLDAQLVECVQSWGDDWGLHGHFFMRLTDVQRLLDDEGEALAGMELPLAA